MSGGLDISFFGGYKDSTARSRTATKGRYDSHNMQKHMEKYGCVSIKTSRYKIVDIDGPEH